MKSYVIISVCPVTNWPHMGYTRPACSNQMEIERGKKGRSIKRFFRPHNSCRIDPCGLLCFPTLIITMFYKFFFAAFSFFWSLLSLLLCSLLFDRLLLTWFTLTHGDTIYISRIILALIIRRAIWNGIVSPKNAEPLYRISGRDCCTCDSCHMRCFAECGGRMWKKLKFSCCYTFFAFIPFEFAFNMRFFTLFVINLIDEKTRQHAARGLNGVYSLLSCARLIFFPRIGGISFSILWRTRAPCIAHYNNHNHHNFEPNEVYVRPKWILHRYFRFIEFTRPLIFETYANRIAAENTVTSHPIIIFPHTNGIYRVYKWNKCAKKAKWQHDGLPKQTNARNSLWTWV